jgi:hypothetical protein
MNQNQDILQLSPPKSRSASTTTSNQQHQEISTSPKTALFAKPTVLGGGSGGARIFKSIRPNGNANDFTAAATTTDDDFSTATADINNDDPFKSNAKLTSLNNQNYDHDEQQTILNPFQPRSKMLVQSPPPPPPPLHNRQSLQQKQQQQQNNNENNGTENSDEWETHKSTKRSNSLNRRKSFQNQTSPKQTQHSSTEQQLATQITQGEQEQQLKNENNSFLMHRQTHLISTERRTSLNHHKHHNHNNDDFGQEDFNGSAAAAAVQNHDMPGIENGGINNNANDDVDVLNGFANGVANESSNNTTTNEIIFDSIFSNENGKF